MIEGMQIKEPKPGDVMIFKDKTLFIFSHSTPAFIESVEGSNQAYLENRSKFRKFAGLKNLCRFATPEEIEKYKSIVAASRHSKEIKNLDLFN